MTNETMQRLRAELEETEFFKLLENYHKTMSPDEAILAIIAAEIERAEVRGRIREVDHFFSDYYAVGWLNSLPFNMEYVKKYRLELQSKTGGDNNGF
jgi:hypothetical protein